MSVEVGAVCGDGPGPQVDVWVLLLGLIFVLYVIVDSALTSVALFRTKRVAS